VEVDGRYWTDFDRTHPLDGPAREQAWTGTVHGLVGELGVGTVTHSTLQMGLALAGVLGGLGLAFLLIGGGVLWAVRAKEGSETTGEAVDMPEAVDIPDTVPEDFREEATTS
jgi:predicted lipid-binding transport protein (Tim44 family)